MCAGPALCVGGGGGMNAPAAGRGRVGLGGGGSKCPTAPEEADWRRVEQRNGCWGCVQVWGCVSGRMGGGGVWHEAMVLVCLPLPSPMGLSPLHTLTPCGPERVAVVSTEPRDALCCLTTPGVGRPGDGGGGGVWFGSRLAPKVVTHGQCVRTSPARLGTPPRCLVYGVYGGGGGGKLFITRTPAAKGSHPVMTVRFSQPGVL